MPLFSSIVFDSFNKTLVSLFAKWTCLLREWLWLSQCRRIPKHDKHKWNQAKLWFIRWARLCVFKISYEKLMCFASSHAVYRALNPLQCDYLTCVHWSRCWNNILFTIMDTLNYIANNISSNNLGGRGSSVMMETSEILNRAIFLWGKP